MEHVFSSLKFIGGAFVTVLRIGYCIGADLHLGIQKRSEAPQSSLLVVSCTLHCNILWHGFLSAIHSIRT